MWKSGSRSTGWERVKAPLVSVRCCLDVGGGCLKSYQEQGEHFPKASVDRVTLPHFFRFVVLLSKKSLFKLVFLPSILCFSLSRKSPTYLPGESLELVLRRSGEKGCGPSFQKGWKQRSAVKRVRPVVSVFPNQLLNLSVCWLLAGLACCPQSFWHWVTKGGVVYAKQMLCLWAPSPNTAHPLPIIFFFLKQNLAI